MCSELGWPDEDVCFEKEKKKTKKNKKKQNKTKQNRAPIYFKHNLQ